MNVTNIYLHTSNRTNRRITTYFKGYALLHNDGIGVSPTPCIRSKLDTIQLPSKGYRETRHPNDSGLNNLITTDYSIVGHDRLIG